MTAVAEAERDLAGQGTPTEAQLLDVLYEVLAQGAPPKGELTTAEVERFLHEHARTKKSIEEMLAFFTRHGLPTNADAYGFDPELGELASGLHRERGPSSALFPLDAAESASVPEPTESGPVRKAVLSSGVDEVPEVITKVEPAPARRIPWLRIAVASLGVTLTAGFAWSYARGRELELQLNQARLQQRSTDSALTALEQRAETLRGSLDQSESERRSLGSRFDAFVAEQAQRRAAEEDALKRLLGPRYEALRAKALVEAAAPSTESSP